MPVVYIIYEYVPSIYYVLIVVFCETECVLVIPVDTTIPVYEIVSSFVKSATLTHFELLEFHRKISPLLIDETEQSVSPANADDPPPVETVALTHFELLEFHCNIWLFVKLDIDASLCFPIDGYVPFKDKLPPDDKLNTFVEL